MPKIEKKQKADVAIPTGSMGDIVFLLLIFFMVTTVFVEYRGISGIRQPRAETTARLESSKRNITHMWISRRGELMVDDSHIDMDMIAEVVYPKRVDNPHILVSIVADIDAPYGTVSDAMKQLRQADALSVNFATLYSR